MYKHVINDAFLLCEIVENHIKPRWSFRCIMKIKMGMIYENCGLFRMVNCK